MLRTISSRSEEAYEKLFRSNKRFRDTDAEDALEQNIQYHNSTKKESTKYTPNALRDLEDKDLIDIIIKNIIKSFKKHKIEKNEIIDVGVKLLLWNNLIIKNDIYYKNDKDKKGCYTYPCLLNNYLNNDIINIELYVNISNDLVRNQVIKVDFNTLILYLNLFLTTLLLKYQKEIIVFIIYMKKMSI